MKRIIQLLGLTVIAALFQGCAGHNHILFMTKSNAGLDFDSKPPTLEITVSRKEVVIAPTFEGGQMPPVAASFKPRAGAGTGFGNFFLGVDQTFEGGDAAVAMASLYSKGGDAPPPSSRTNYNSALTLTQPPRYTGFFRRVPGPGETRTFIFGTDTSLGLKVAWSGAGGQFPDTVRLGFNRKEFAWAPIFVATNPPADTNTAATYSVKMPSFLATIQSHIETGSSNGGISALQYFAAGETATLLALQPAVREAMIKRLDPEAATIGEKLDRTRLKNKELSQQAKDLINAIPDTDTAGLTNAVIAELETGLMPEDQKATALALIPTEPAKVKKGLCNLAVAGDDKRGEQLKAFIKKLSN